MRLLLTLPLLMTFACRSDTGETDTSPVDDTGPTADDADGDGSPAGEDCNDADPAIHPSAVEKCNGVDDDCDGGIDLDATDASTFYGDGDGDGYGDASDTQTGCDAPSGYASDPGDCDDANPAVHPGAAETDCADPTDYNCDGSTGFADADGDGSPACEDCDDTSASSLPGGTEVCDGADNDCDGTADEEATDGATFYADADADGFGDASSTTAACEAPSGYTSDATDCDDASGSVYPGATEACNGVDEDCDGTVDEDAPDASTWYADADGDGHGDPSATALGCTQPTGHVSSSDDCDDANAAAFPGGTEVCDGADNDCDGSADVDATDAKTWYEDADADTFGGAKTAEACAAPTGYVSATGDCDDAAADVNPEGTPACDDADHDCDGAVDFDADGDGWSDAACGGADCDDATDKISPDLDDDCSCDEADDGSGAGPLCPAFSCTEIKKAGLDDGDRFYWLVPDGKKAGDAFPVYCDMTRDGGGWQLLADYRSNLELFAFDLTKHQEQNKTGGAPLTDPPRLDGKTPGHIAYTTFPATGQELMLECRNSPSSAWTSHKSKVVHDWTLGDKGTYGSTDWGILGGAGYGRNSHFMCGVNSGNVDYRGVGLCNGPGAGGSWTNHMVSFAFNRSGASYGGGLSIGCKGTGINEGKKGEWEGRVWTRREAPKLLGSWQFEGNYEDSSGNDEHGKPGGSANIETNEGRKAAHFSGSGGASGTDSVSWVELPNINPREAITVASWIKSGTPGRYNGVWQLVSKYNAFILGTGSTDSNNMCFIISSSGWRYDTCYNVPDPQKWHHFVGTYDATSGEKRLYVDGVLKDADFVGRGLLIDNDTGPIDLGHRECCDHGGFNGWMDDVRIYDRALSAGEAQLLFAGEL